ncbi:MAG: methylmalonyl-CoA mutase [Proteobacteria bacterium]|nr:methylmalonyl-CoA mutase [Pseudomonadota bacterium]
MSKSKKISKAYNDWKKHDSSVGDSLAIPTEENFSEDSYLSNIGFPGQFPYTRGIHPSMYLGKLWTMRQYAGFGSAEETNRRYHYLLSQGITGLSVAFDLPTQMGRDSDDTFANGEVGKVGVAIDTIEDMELLFAGIELDKISTSMTINSTAHILLALYIALAKKNNIPLEKLRGTIQNDILKEYIARGTYVYPPLAALKIATDIFEYSKDVVPEWYTISISGYHIREAGSTAAQEIAFTLLNAMTYVESALTRGMKIDQFAPRLAFFFNCHNDFLCEVAKFRAARRMWAKIMKNKYHANDEKSLMLRFHTQTAGSSLTAAQSQVNVVRTTIQALSAVLGGTQSLHTNAYDEAICLPTEQSAKLALRTQQVIAEESGLAKVIDPLAGSYYLEQLTDQLESEADKIITDLLNKGGMVKAIENSIPQSMIESAAYEYQKKIENKEIKVVGVNCYQESGEQMPELLKVDPEFEKRQIAKLATFKEKRDAKMVASYLEQIKLAAKEDRNIMPHVVTAVEGFCSLGEISNVLREVYGEYR